MSSVAILKRFETVNPVDVSMIDPKLSYRSVKCALPNWIWPSTTYFALWPCWALASPDGEWVDVSPYHLNSLLSERSILWQVVEE
ncbi:hypothetical protein BB934_32855 (plasmid) [Microvirga ossetica]|uniref:Uncharacterized protein n=1 Tax=Microvirga ossetica TaxID=1882682 RepID=A0A1B2ESP8_9HYPH|nr:hypothetical protein [Microvirga ossetica]ANY83005.1 hypothetical protein BB934_32855 [Microvirga ossetica]